MESALSGALGELIGASRLGVAPMSRAGSTKRKECDWVGAWLDWGECYAAPHYHVAIRRGDNIRYFLVNADEIRFCSTPVQYEERCARAAFSPV